MTPEYFKAPPNCGTGRGDPPKGAWGGFQPPLPKLCFGVRFDPGPDGLGGFWEPPNTSRVTQERDPLEGTLMSWGPPPNKKQPLQNLPREGGPWEGFGVPGCSRGSSSAGGWAEPPPGAGSRFEGGGRGRPAVPAVPTVLRVIVPIPQHPPDRAGQVHGVTPGGHRGVVRPPDTPNIP